MNQLLEVTYYYHSGFSCAMGDVLCIFDYWTGEHGELPMERRITPEYLRSFREVYVFVTHSHEDHADPEVFTWHKTAPCAYIVSYEMPIGTRGRRMNPGDKLTLSEHVSVTAYDSTDLGVSFLLEFDGVRIFHAGDLNSGTGARNPRRKRLLRPRNRSMKRSNRCAGRILILRFFRLIPGKAGSLTRVPTTSLFQ